MSYYPELQLRHYTVGQASILSIFITRPAKKAQIVSEMLR